MKGAKASRLSRVAACVKTQSHIQPGSTTRPQVLQQAGRPSHQGVAHLKDRVGPISLPSAVWLNTTSRMTSMPRLWHSCGSKRGLELVTSGGE